MTVSAETELARIRALAEQADWDSLLALGQRLRASGLSVRDNLLIADLMRDWVTALAAVAPDSAVLMDAPVPQACHAALRCRIELGFLPETIALGRALQARHGPDPALAAFEATAFERMNRLPEALAVHHDRLALGADAALVDMVRLVLIMGDPAEAARILKRHARAVAPRVSLEAQILLHKTRGQRHHAIARLAALRALPEVDTGFGLRLQSQLALQLDCPDLQREPMAHLRSWLAAPEEFAALRRHAPLILRSQWQFDSDREATITVMTKIGALLLDPSRALVLRSVMIKAGMTLQAIQLLERTAAAFPANPDLWRELLRLRARIDSPDTLAALRARIFAALPEQTALDTLCHNHSQAWDRADLPRMIQHGFTTPTFRVRDVFKAVLQRLPDLSPAAISALRTVADKADPIDALSIELLQARHAEQAAHQNNNITAAARSRHRRQVGDRIAQARARIIATVAGSDFTNPGRQLIASGAGFLQAIEDATPAERFHIYTAESLADASAVVAWLTQRVQNGQPTALVRLGDGEGHFLSFDAALRTGLAHDRKEMMHLWWNREWPDETTARRIIAQFRRAVAAADILGVLPDSRVVRIYQSPGRVAVSNRGVIRALSHVAGHVIAPGNSQKARPRLWITSAQVQRDLANWGMWEQLLQTVPGQQVSWIAPHDLAPLLRSRFGLSTRRGVMIPGEARYASMFDPNTAQSGTLLDRHETVRAELQASPGEVWLVAAGFLGKIYIHTLRRQGGIALDIGSLADDWMGYATRIARARQGPEP